ncbi:hypothetical protein [Ruminococcus sp.]|uniref:hypothetical protein n=1 Tax=Ruminococcus sp. TaxID=41978 RepID=UPI0025FB7DD4|nr:hypothetical protein [Ruminococcus sp.]
MTLNELLALPFSAADCPVLKHIYDWNNTVPDTLESLPNLRNRVAINDLKSYLDNKNPAPAATGNGAER